MQRVVIHIDKAFTVLESLAEKLPEPLPEIGICTNDIKCPCQQFGCMGYIAPIDNYLKEL